MSLEPRIPLLLDDASDLGRVQPNWTAQRSSQNNDLRSQENSGNGLARSGKAGVPLAEVLNAEKQPRTHAEDSSDFAGPPSKRQRFEDSSSGNFFRLPKPEIKKKDRRRIPPLIQGLHHPPPDAGLFPPITADNKHEAPASGLRHEAEPESRVQQVQEPGHDPPSNTSKPVDKHTNPAEDKANQPRKKNKWTKEETEDLLKGVAKFGVGNWKAILSREEFSFHGRSAIDLKDRFRTCFPEAYNRYKASASKKPKLKEQNSSSDVTNTLDHPIQDDHDGESTELQNPKPKSSRSHRMKPEDLTKLGIEGPFIKKNRRERRVWTEEEDAVLLKGLSDYGAQWAQIAKDAVLENRRPTDLRDRVRNRWPEKYLEAGLTMRPKEISRPVQRAGKAPDAAKAEISSSPQSDPRPTTPGDKNKSEPSQKSTRTASAAKTTRAHPPPPLKLLNAPISELLTDDFPSLGSYDEMVPASPITLDRSIFDWVNQNITQSATIASTSQPHSTTSINPSSVLPSAMITDTSLNGFDSLHINPLVTLNKPYKNSSMNTIPPLITPISLQTFNFAAPTSYTGNGSATSSALPNGLPSMNLGYTSTSGATVSGTTNAGPLNLPPPSEVLAGFIDGDIRGEGHTGGTGPLLWDELLN